LKLQPTLTGENVELRPLRADDFDALFAVASDPLIWEQHPERFRYQPEVFRKYFDSGLAARSAFTIFERKSGAIIGSTRYYEYSAERSDVSVGYSFIARAYWGGPTNREVKTLLLDHAFRSVGSVLFHVGRENTRSRKAIEKIGGVEEPFTADKCAYRIRKPV
jgi:RimJ/RimL family protein N-acetyltransferase